MPGFTYLGGLDERIHTPRLANPRIKINAGERGDRRFPDGNLSAGFPGGWQLMGMTPVKPMTRAGENPILVEAGDYIRFVPVDEQEYKRIKRTGGQRNLCVRCSRRGGVVWAFVFLKAEC